MATKVKVALRSCGSIHRQNGSIQHGTTFKPLHRHRLNRPSRFAAKNKVMAELEEAESGILPLMSPHRSEPERAPLQFPIKASSHSPEMAEVVLQIKELAEKALFHWTTFPIVLPRSLSQLNEINFSQLFLAPSFDELEQVATDSLGNLKKLTDQQLTAIWEKGEFEVASVNFPGQTHRWRLTQWLQKGSNRAHDSMLKDMSLALYLLIITARNRVISPFFSLSQSVKSWGIGLWKILDMLFGMPSTEPDDLDHKIPRERMRYLVAELDVKPSYKQGFARFCHYVKETSRLPNAEKMSTLRPPPIPFVYQTPKGLDIDLRLFDKDLINNCLPVLSNILDREAKGWYVEFRNTMISDLKGQGLTVEEISKTVNEAIMEEYLQRVFKAVLVNVELDALAPGIGALLVSQAKSVIAMEKATSTLKQDLENHKNNLLTHLKKNYPVKSRIKPWVKKQLEAFHREFVLQHQWAAHEEAILLCEKQDLPQAVYFLQRDLNFMKLREAILLKELGGVRIPRRVFSFTMRIWFPRNWLTYRTFDEVETLVPTLFDDEAGRRQRQQEPGEAYYVNKSTVRRTTSRYPLWRLYNYLHRTWAWMWNSIFMLGVVLPFCSPVSFRALISVDRFFPNKEIDRHTGLLHEDKKHDILTLMSRLSAIWASVKKSRKDFEATPDRGFLGKALTRHFNRFWNYVVKGILGSTLLVLTFPVICVSLSTLSIIIAIAAPLWIPVLTLLYHIFMITVFDFDCPGETNRFSILCEAVIWRFLIQGTLQPVAAVLVAGVACPIGAMFLSVFGVLRRGARGFWDSVMYKAVIKTRARVPASNGFVARRIAGPGLASKYLLQIHPEQALAALEASMEIEALEAFKSRTMKTIDEPIYQYRKFFNKLFGPFSGSVNGDGVFKQLQVEASNYRTDLTNMVNVRLRKLNTGISMNVQNNAKMTEKQLKMTILQAASMLKEFYPRHVFSQMSGKETGFWMSHTLEPGDWAGFASQKLAQLFSPSILIPMEMTDNYFELKIEHLNLGRYVKMLATSTVHDDLDIVESIHTNASEVSTQPPQLDVYFFNPSHKIIDTRRYTMSRRRGRFPWASPLVSPTFDKLQVPLPLLHPAKIAITIFNRQHEQHALRLEDGFTYALTKVLQSSSAVAEVDTNAGSTDMEMSTPDNMEEYVNTLSVVSHLAEQEQSISDDNSTQANTPLIETTMTALPTATPSFPFQHRARTYMVDDETPDPTSQGSAPASLQGGDNLTADNASIMTGHEIGDDIYMLEDDGVRPASSADISYSESS